MTILDDIATERTRAHAKHGGTSMESYPADDLNRLAILDEEVGEVAKEFNEARHEGRPVDLDKLRKELIQTAAMAAAWADACGHSAAWVDACGHSATPYRHRPDVVIPILSTAIVICVGVAVALIWTLR